jgi:hypothetical protein
VFQLGHPNVRGVADRLGSPNRLSANLEELVNKRCLHLDREGNQHRYTITKMGLRYLAKYDGDAAGASIGSLTAISRAAPEIGQPEVAKITAGQLVQLIVEYPTMILQLVNMIAEKDGDSKVRGADGLFWRDVSSRLQGLSVR